jgi:hypothetical protein
LEKYVINFEANGYDNLAFIGGDGIMTIESLQQIGIVDSKDIQVLLESLKQRENKFNFDVNGQPASDISSLQLEDWLASIELQQYSANFYNNLWDNMSRVKTIWDEELTSILEIEKSGHRHRILLSLAGPKGMKDQMGKVSKLFLTNSEPLESKKADPNVQKIIEIPHIKEKVEINGSANITTLNKKNVSHDVPNSLEIKSFKAPSGTNVPQNSVIDVSKTASTVTRATEDIPLCSLHSAQRRKTSSSATSNSSASTGSDKFSEKVSSSSRQQQYNSRTSTGITESGTLTLGRRKKKAPQPPNSGEIGK